MQARKLAKKMEGIGSVRLRLGMTQESFAALLNISRSHLAGCESSGRKLGKGLEKLAWLEIQLHHNASNRTKSALTPPPDWQQNRMAGSIEQFAREAEQSRLNAVCAEARLALMKGEYQVILRQLSELDMLIATCNGAETEPPVSLYHLQLHRNVLLDELADCDIPAQWKLQHQISLYHAASHLQEAAVGRLKAAVG